MAALVEKALLSDLIARRVAQDGAEAVFGAHLVSDFEKLPAGVLLRRLRDVGYEPGLAARLGDAIDERNRFIHRLFYEPEFIRTLAGGQVRHLEDRIEKLVAEFYDLLGELKPQVADGIKAMFPVSIVGLHAEMQTADLSELGEGEFRRQFEAIRDLPNQLVAEMTQPESRELNSESCSSEDGKNRPPNQNKSGGGKSPNQDQGDGGDNE